MLESEIQEKIGQYFFKWTETLRQTRYILKERELLEGDTEGNPTGAWVLVVDHSAFSTPREIDKDGNDVDGLLPFKVNTDFFTGRLRWEDGTEIGLE